MDSSFSHVALLVPSVDKSAEILQKKEISCLAPEVFEAEGTKEIYVGSYDDQRGLLLLLEAIGEGPYKRALAKRGPSLHHLAVDVLQLDEFVNRALAGGWSLHSISEETRSYGVAWLFKEGVPTLVEVCQKKTLSSKPGKVSRITLPVSEDLLPLFSMIGLEKLVSSGEELFLTIDGHKMSFSEIVDMS